MRVFVLFWHALPLVVAGVALWVYSLGYDRGVKHTEERWSDAVNRKFQS